MSSRPCATCWRHVLTPLVLSVYVDRFATIGTNAAHVREVGNAAHALGLKTHEFSIFELLGLSHSDTGLLGPHVRRQWKLRQALRIVHASSRDVSVVVGHFTSLAMVGRELLCVCRAVHVFADRELSHRRVLCPALRRELEWMPSCLFLLISDLSVPWWVPSEINVADKRSPRGLRPFTKNRPHHPTPDVNGMSRFAHGAPARGTSQNHAWNQIVSPPFCGHRRSGARRRGIKKELLRAGATTSTGGKKKQESSPLAASLCVHPSRKDGPRVEVRWPNDPERLRAVAAPTRVQDAGDLRQH